MKSFTKFTNPFLWCFLFCVQIGFAQLVSPCPSNTIPPADDCGECIYCGFNGLMSSTAGYNPGSVPGFCGSIENNQWLGFIAGETGATFSAFHISSTNGDGVQLALMDATCSALLGCYSGQSGGASVPATISVNNMVEGQTYYLMIDGFAGDQCIFRVNVSPNSAIVPPFPFAPDSISGPSVVCRGTTEQYCIPPVEGAAAYVWTTPAGVLVNGMPSPVTILANAGLCADITWPPTPTAGPILVNGINSCFSNTPPVVKVVNSLEIGSSSSYSVNTCLPYTLPWGQIATAVGTFTHTYTSSTGCDSIVTVELEAPFEVFVVDSVASNCNGMAELNASTTANTPQYMWSNGATIPNPSVSSSGTYTVTVTDGVSGCSLSASTTVIQGTNNANVEVFGGNLSCAVTSVNLTTQTNVTNAAYLWSTGETIASVSVTNPGFYGVTITDLVTGCTAQDSIFIESDVVNPVISIAPPALLTCAITAVPIFVTVAQATNLRYDWSYDGQVFQMTTNGVSNTGIYTVVVTNLDNGCSATGNTTVHDNISAPMLVLPIPAEVNCCNASTILELSSVPANGVTYAWSGAGGQFTTQQPTVSNPGLYEVTVTNSINGCTSTISTTVLGDFDLPTIVAEGGILTCANPTVMLSASSNEPGSFMWTGPNGFNSNSSSPTVDSAGSYTVTMQAVSNCCVAQAVVSVVDSCFVSTFSLDNKSQIRVFPNATSGQLFVESLDVDFPIHAVTVQALDGKILVEKTNLNTNLQELDLGKYAKGMYLLWAEVGGKKLLFKVLLQ